MRFIPFPLRPSDHAHSRVAWLLMGSMICLALHLMAIPVEAVPDKETVPLVLVPPEMESRAVHLLLRGIRQATGTEPRVAGVHLGEQTDKEDAGKAYDQLHENLLNESISGVVAVGSRVSAFCRMFQGLTPLIGPQVFINASEGDNDAYTVTTEEIVSPLVTMIRHDNPKAQTAIVLTGMYRHDRKFRERISTALEPAILPIFPGHEAGRKGILSPEQLSALVQSVPPQSVVILYGLPVNNPSEKLMEMVVQKSPAPVYASGPTPLLPGMRGGVVINWQALGNRAGETLNHPRRTSLQQTVAPIIQTDIVESIPLSLPAASDQGNTDTEPPSHHILALAIAGFLLIPAICFLLIRRR